MAFDLNFSPRWRFSVRQHQKFYIKLKYLYEKHQFKLCVKDGQIMRQKLQMSNLLVLETFFVTQHA